MSRVLILSIDLKLVSLSITYIGFIILIGGLLTELAFSISRNKSLENELNVIKYEKAYLCKQCFNNLLEKADNKLDFLWKAILSNSIPMMNAFLRTLFTPVQISKEKVVLETSSKSISNHFESKRKLFI